MTSEFWRQLAGEHTAQLDARGLALVKRVQALRYFTWRWDRRRFFADQGRYLLAKAPRTSWLRAIATRVNLSDDAWAPVDWPRRDRWFYTIATRVLWDFARRHGSSAVLDLAEPMLGSPLPVPWRGRLISQDLANSSLEVASLREALGGREPKHVLEVGAGYGRTAHALLSIWPETEYTIIDIEPAISISRWYLTSLFPDRDLRFVDAGDRAASLQPFDAAVSISSLQEMTPVEIGRYFQLLDHLAAPGAVVYLKQWEGWLNPVDAVRHSMDQYPVPSRWRTVFRRPAPVQTMFDEAAWVVDES
jgi:putative sugar O-methyltransferase